MSAPKVELTVYYADDRNSKEAGATWVYFMVKIYNYGGLKNLSGCLESARKMIDAKASFFKRAFGVELVPSYEDEWLNFRIYPELHVAIQCNFENVFPLSMREKFKNFGFEVW